MHPSQAWVSMRHRSLTNVHMRLARRICTRVDNRGMTGEQFMASKLQGKAAVITGGTVGIGFAIAKRFVDGGAFVFITGRRQKQLDEAEKALGNNVRGVRADVAELQDLDSLYETVRAKGKIDVLVANAGIGEFAPLASLTEEHFDKTFNTNVKGLLFTVQKALPLLPDGASIILNASIVSIKGMAAFSVYSATKAAVISLGKTLAVELAPRGVRVNVLSPGPIDTPIIKKMGLPADQLKGFEELVVAKSLLKRWGTSDEVARAARFLLSEDSSNITGTELIIDGGVRLN